MLLGGNLHIIVYLEIFDCKVSYNNPSYISLQLFPSHIPDLSSRSPLIVSGRYDGGFPDTVKISGTLADMNNFVIELKVQRAKDVPLERVMF